MASPLSNLPVEVIEAIARNLDRVSLFSLRLSCRAISRKTLHHFGHACFGLLKTDFSHNDLQRLRSISKDERFRHCVKILVIMDKNNGLGRGFYWHRLEEGSVDTRLSSGVQLLQDILKGMTKCNSFYIFLLSGMEDDTAMEYLLTSDAIGIIFSLVAETGLPVKAFFLNYTNPDSGNAGARRLQISLCQRPTFRNAWKTIEELEIWHSLTSNTFEWAKDLIIRTTNLKKLRLKLDRDHTTSFIGDLVAVPHVFQRLQEFDLGTAHVSVDMLSSILMESRSSLRVLSFWAIDLQKGTWVTILEQIRDRLPLLESICVDWLTESINGEKIYIDFPSLKTDRVVPDSNGRKFELRYFQGREQKKVQGASYHGRQGMDKALDILAKSAVYD